MSRVEKTWLWCRRHPLIAGLYVALATAIGIGLTGIGILTVDGIGSTLNVSDLTVSGYVPEGFWCVPDDGTGDHVAENAGNVFCANQFLARTPGYLLDVAPFVELLTSGMYQAEADINMDGEVNLLMSPRLWNYWQVSRGFYQLDDLQNKSRSFPGLWSLKTNRRISLFYQLATNLLRGAWMT